MIKTLVYLPFAKTENTNGTFGCEWVNQVVQSDFGRMEVREEESSSN